MALSTELALWNGALSNATLASVADTFGVSESDVIALLTATNLSTINIEPWMHLIKGIGYNTSEWTDGIKLEFLQKHRKRTRSLYSANTYRHG